MQRYLHVATLLWSLASALQDRVGRSRSHVEFKTYIQRYGRVYRAGSREYSERRAVFDDRLAEIQRHNAKPDELWTAGVNHLTDRTEEELRHMHGWRGMSRGSGAAHGRAGELSLRQSARGESLPEEVSWAALNASRTVHNQGSCGSCWAVATLHMLEAAHEIATKAHARFDINELIDCTPNPHKCGGTGGCDGATVELATDYVAHNGLRSLSAAPSVTEQIGISVASLDEYSNHELMEFKIRSAFAGHYIGGFTGLPELTIHDAQGESILNGHGAQVMKLFSNGEFPLDLVASAAFPVTMKFSLTKTKQAAEPKSCAKDATQGMSSMESLVAPKEHVLPEGTKGHSIGLVSWERLPENSYLPLLMAVAEHGPVAVSVAANGWEVYSDGIFSGCVDSYVINHAVTLIGYGKSKGVKYWHVQNSWGPEWGEQGRIRLLRHDDEESACGIDEQPEQGTGCENGPTEVKVCGRCGILYDSVVAKFK